MKMMVHVHIEDDGVDDDDDDDMVDNGPDRR